MTLVLIAEASLLADALAPVQTLVDECKIHCESDGLEIAAVDPANVAMVDLSVDTSACAHYEADGGVIGVNLERLSDVLGMADSGDMVRLELDAETRKLDIEIGGLEYTLALIDPDSIRQEPDLPDLDLAATYAFEGGELSRAITAADLCSDHVALAGVDADELRVTAEGDTDDVEVTVDGDRLLSGQFDDPADGPVQSLFSLDYLDDIAAPIATDDSVSLRVGDELPLTLQYSRADGDVSVTHLLAPRIQSD